MSPEAGWYADPTDPDAVRWWDGAQWTTQTRPAPRELVLAGAAASTSAGSLAADAAAGPDLARSGPRHAAPAAPEPAPTPAPAEAAPAADTVDRSRPGARPPAAPPTAPADAEAVDRSRPGARRPAVVLPTGGAASVAVATPPAPTVAVAPPASWVPDQAPAAGHGFGTAPAGFGGAPAGFGGAPTAFGARPAGFGAGPAGPVHTGGYSAQRSWKKPVAVLAVTLLALGGLAAYGLPKYTATRAEAVAAQQPDILLRTAPAALAGQRKLAVAGMNTASLVTSLTAAGSSWAWVQTYGTRSSLTIYLASDVPLSERPTAVSALTSHDAAGTLLATVSAALTNGANGKLVAGTPAEYASPVAGKTWCMPVTASGVQGGYCLWTSGKELLQTLSLPGLQEVAAKSTLDALAQMAKAVTKAESTGSLLPRTPATAS